MNAVRPGYVRTGMHEEDLRQSPDWVRANIASIPVGRIAEVRDVSTVVFWLMSDEASYVTGSIVDIFWGTRHPMTKVTTAYRSSWLPNLPHHGS